MTEQDTQNYKRIEIAIKYIQENFISQPDLDEVASRVNMSPHYFQRLFSEWAGVSPKKFLQYITLDYAKSLLRNNQPTLFDVAHESGLSGTGRLHDLFITIEGMTPAEYKNGGKDISIKYSFVNSPFGKLLVASTERGICHMAFADDGEKAFVRLQSHFPNARYTPMHDEMQQNVLHIFKDDWSNLNQIKLHLKGTDFQLKVWETLLKIPVGKLATYGTIASRIHNPNACRAVGTAIGSNPVAYLIPCHRVIQSSGAIGGYMWGSTRKTAIIGWEGVRT